MDEQAYTSNFPTAQVDSSSFHSAPPPPPQPSSSFNPTDTSDQTSIPPLDYPSVLSSSPTLSSSPSITPSLQQTTFTFPTPPPSNSSSPQPLLSSSSSSPSTYHTLPDMIAPHTTTDTSFPPQISAHPLLNQESQPLRGEAGGNNPATDPSSAAFIYPNILPMNHDPDQPQPLHYQNQAVAPALSCSLPSHGAATSFAFTSHMQNFSLPKVSAGPAHSALHLPNLSHQGSTPSFNAAFTHPSASLPHPSFQPPSSSSSSSCCLAIPPSFPQPVTSAPAHPQNLPAVSNSTYASVERGTIPHFNHPAPYRPEMVRHHTSLLPQLDPSLPSSTPPPPALYPAFPSYPLRLCQDPHSSLSIPFRHLYRQHGHGHPQGSYLDMGTRPVF